MDSSKKRYVYYILTVLLILMFVYSFKIGSIDISFKEIVELATNYFGSGDLTAKNQTELVIITRLRLPRILAAILCGAALSVSGTALQSMFLNPLVSPDILGVLAGAALGSALGIVFGNTMFYVQLGAVVFGILAVFFSIFISGLFPGNRLIMLIIGGIISSSFFVSLLSVIQYLADSTTELPAIVYWLMGGFSSVTLDSVAILGPVIFLSIMAVIFLSDYLNLLSMGDEEAQTLGVRVTLIRNIIIFIVTLMSAMTVSLGGIIGWVGLMIPHISRMIVGPDNRVLVPVSGLVGALYLLMIDNICRGAFSTELPIGIMTSLIGLPFFVFILAKTGKRWTN